MKRKAPAVKTRPKVPPEVSAYFSRIGRAGGQACRGETKRRAGALGAWARWHRGQVDIIADLEADLLAGKGLDRAQDRATGGTGGAVGKSRQRREGIRAV